MEELSDMYMWSADDLGVEETGKTGGVSVGDFSLANKHEPLDASHGARIMAKEVGRRFFIIFKVRKIYRRFYKEKRLLVVTIGTIFDKLFQKRAIHKK